LHLLISHSLFMSPVCVFNRGRGREKKVKTDIKTNCSRRRNGGLGY